MRIDEGLSNYILNMDFKRLGTNIKRIQLFYRPANAEVEIIVFLYVPSGKELTTEEYERLLSNIKDKFNAGGFSSIRLLGIIFTEAPDMAKQYCLEQDDHWIIDLTGRRLIIYENQADDFLGLKSKLEQLLEDEYYLSTLDSDTGVYMDQYRRQAVDETRKTVWITVFNTILIAINIITFLVVHFTGVLGGTEQIMAEGALSWYFVKEEGEYYRILTSMFLHSDFGHLINNMLVLFFVGDNLERAAGKVKYLMIYFGTGIIAGISSISYNMIKGDNVFSIGASGAIFGIVGAVAYILFVNKGRLEDISGRQILLFTLFSLYGGITSVNIDNVAHIGGFVAGILLAAILYRRPKNNVLNREADYE